jgi:RHS repeat-associated protein
VDENWLRGREVETRRLKADNTPLTRSVNWPTWTLTAGSGKTGAYFVGTQAAEQTTYGSTNKTTRTETTYDSYGNVLRQVLKGDLATPDDDRHILRGFTVNTSAYIVDTPQWEKLYAGAGEPVCTTYASTDVPKTIPASGTPTVLSTLTVPDSGLITDVNVLGLNGTHTYIDDLIFTLLSPTNAQTILMNRACTSQDNFNISFDDESANAAGTWPCPPTNGGTYRPDGSLAAFDAGPMPGTWTLQVQDVYTNDGGSLNGWQLQICRTPPAGDPLAFTEYAYDGQAVGAAPLKGNQTLTRAYSQVTPAAVYVDTVTGYDAYGRPTTVTDPNGRTTTTAYHPFYGYAQSVTNALSQTSSTVVDPGWGAPVSVTDINGRVTNAQYDVFGRLAKVWLPTEPTNGPASKEFVYAPEARPAWIKTRQLKDAATSGYLEAWGYFDGFGRSLQSQAPLANGNRTVAATGLDTLGQTAYQSAAYELAGAAGSGYVTPTWSSLANYSYTTYDELGRALRRETRSGATQLWATRATYDGWTTAAYDANDHRQDATADAFGQTVRVTEYNTGGVTYTTNYTYSLTGALAQVRDAASNVTIIGYDLLGRKTSMSDPDMGSWQYVYDAAGNLTSQRDGAQRWLYLEYDARNRLIRKRQELPNGPIVAEWQYDAAGQLGLPSKSKAYSSQGTIEVWTVAYDVRNRPTQQQTTVPGAGGGVFRFDTTYTTAGQRATLRYPGGNAGQQGEVVTFGYNAVGQLATVISDDGTQYIASTTYNAQGQAIEQRMDSGANGFTRQSAYNANTLRLETLKAGKTAPFENLQKLAYTYDLAGNVQTLTDSANSGQVQSFGYDWLDRLTSAATNAAGVGQYSHTYAYNAIGNITSYNGNAYTYGAKPHAVTTAFGNAYGYDGVGNQTSRTVSGVAHTQSFDYDNRLIAVAGGSVSATFLYDAEGNRVKGTVGGVTTVYLAGIYEWQNGAFTKYYEGGTIRRTGYASSNGVFYTLADHLRSTSVLVNQNGTVNGRNYYYPYGGNRGGSAFSSLTTKRFTGQYHEQGLPGGEGLSYYNARWYDAQVGVFISADTLVPSPLAPQTLNRYAYVRGNPLRYQDPTGHRACEDDDCLNSGPVILRVTTKGRSYDSTQYIRTYRYGYIDVRHFEGGVVQARSIIAQIRAGENRVTIRQHVRAGIHFEATYRVHNRPTPEAVEGVALGIFMDYSWQFEKWQNRGLGSVLMEGVQGSSFSAEDLSTDYLGFYSAARDQSLATIVRKLGGEEPTQGSPPKVRAWGLVGDRQSKNFSFTPRVKQGASYQNVPWPQDMTITPITDSSYWQREGERTIWPWTDFLARFLP